MTTLGPGEWLVRRPGPGPAAQTGGPQVTAANPAKPAVCDVASWAWTPSEQDIRVRCYDALAAPQPPGWSLTCQSGRAITGAAPKLHAYTLNNLLSGAMDPTQSLVSYDTNS